MSIPVEYLENPIELRYIPDNRLIVSFPQGLKNKPQFSSELDIKKYMEECGVAIPHYEQENFGDRKIILAHEEDFGIAFFRFYCRVAMPPDKYKWLRV